MTLPDSLRKQLDPAFGVWLEASNPPLPVGFQPTVEQMRSGFAQQVAISNGPIDASLTVEDDEVTGRDGNPIGLRFYRHKQPQDTPGFCCFLHGGGWVLGDLDTHQGICNDLAVHTGMTVVAIQYRLSPEHVFPAALHDTIDVLKALSSNPSRYAIDGSQMCLMADSAGASLALSACLELRGTSALPAKLALVYPAVGADIERPSFKENQDLPGLSRDSMRFFFTSYVGGEELPDPLAAPLTVDDLSGLPPTFISGAQFDPLRDDATDLAARLNAAEVPVQLRIEAGLGHGYLWVRRASVAAAAAFSEVVAFLSPGKH